MDWFLYDNGFRHEKVKKKKIGKSKTTDILLTAILDYLSTLTAHYAKDSSL